MARSLEKTVLHALGKVDGKSRTWVVGVFNDVKTAKPFAAMLKFHYSAKNTDALKAMDPTAPLATDGTHPTDVKFSASIAPYAPEIAGLDDSDVIG